MGHSMQFAYLHQLYTIASRLYHDLALTNHKYIAYQLALLYVRRCPVFNTNINIISQQCINRQGVEFVEYKSRIEQRFDEIKTATKQTTLIVLEKDQTKW
jgi:hypothetical protein